MYVRGIESGVCGFYTTVYRVILLMLEVSKVDRELSIQCYSCQKMSKVAQ